MEKEVAVFWFRRDLRLEDNRGFSRALSSGLPVIPIFLFDEAILNPLKDRDDARVAFLHATVADLRSGLRDRGSDLIVLSGAPQALWEDIFKAGLSVESGESKSLPTYRVKHLFYNHDYEPAAIRRDAAIEKIAMAAGAEVSSFKDQVIFEKSEVTKDDGKPYTVFTPYSKKWLAKFEEQESSGHSPSEPENCGRSINALLKFRYLKSDMPSIEELGFRRNDKIEIPGVRVSTKLLQDYANLRDVPSIIGTSRLGIHLRFGTVSIRKLVKVARDIGADIWLRELIWREFFMQILWHFPHVEKGGFRPEYDQIRWVNDENDFRAWCEGKTGFPIVDAGMRELNATGFMHNRVRMIAGSFLVKHLLVDWRWGEAYFARRLLDFELASNNGNWQWVAGSGCDAAPYFRVFSPDRQTEKFDPKHEYIRKWVPEFQSEAYPNQLVDHAEARERALRAYAAVKTKKDGDIT